MLMTTRAIINPDMSTRGQSGFTIIETTLFLAVTGLLILLVVAGTGVSLNVQRYRDAVDDFKSIVQQQYASLSSVQNGRNDNWSCNRSSASVSQGGSSTESRGQSGCMLLGKYMRIERSQMTIYPVVGVRVSTNTGADITSMANYYAMNVVASEADDRTLGWGTEIAWTATAGRLDYQSPSTPRNIGILFIRSPESGQIYTFTSNTIPNKDSITAQTFSNMISASGARNERMVCLESGGLFVNGDMGLYIAPYASGTSAIETRTNDNQDSISKGLKCD